MLLLIGITCEEQDLIVMTFKNCLCGEFSKSGIYVLRFKLIISCLFSLIVSIEFKDETVLFNVKVIQVIICYCCFLKGCWGLDVWVCSTSKIKYILEHFCCTYYVARARLTMIFCLNFKFRLQNKKDQHKKLELNSLAHKILFNHDPFLTTPF